MQVLHSFDRGEGWFFPFAAMVGFSGWVVKHGSTDECASYNIGIWTWFVMALVGRQHAPKSASFTYFLLRSSAPYEILVMSGFSSDLYRLGFIDSVDKV